MAWAGAYYGSSVQGHLLVGQGKRKANREAGILLSPSSDLSLMPLLKKIFLVSTISVMPPKFLTDS